MMYELFILSKLLHRPMHGYLIQTILNSAIGPFRQLSWGTLYPLMKRLEENGYIIEVDAGAEDPRGKKRYRTTEAGRRRLIELMNDCGDLNANSPDLFRIKLGCLGHLDGEARVRILKDYRTYLVRIVKHSESMSDRVANEENLQLVEQGFAMLGLEHQKIVAESEIRWIDRVLNERTLLTDSDEEATGRRSRTKKRTSAKHQVR